MEITITGRRMPITDPIRAYAEEKIGNSMKVMDINPLDAEVVLMVCDNPGAKVVERAAAHGVGAFVFAPKQYASKADYEREIVARLDAAGVELVCLAGYMRIVGDVLLGAYGGGGG